MTITFKARAFAAALTACAASAHAVTFETENLSGSFDSTISAGFGVRTQSPGAGTVLSGATGVGAPMGTLAVTSGYGDQGNLNYGRGDFFTAYLKGSHELLLQLPDGIRAMARVSWLRDFAATNTTGYTSAGTPPYLTLNGGLTSDARDDLRFKARVLDLWVSKTFTLGDQQARVRVGNQVVSWGESLFIPGGINATNALDLMRLSQPGTQLKEAVLPAPMISFASGLGHGMNVEGYVQAAWNENYFPPTGSYWSASNGLGKGHQQYGIADVKARNAGQWGLALKMQPESTSLNFGLYTINYHDKSPQLRLDQSSLAPSFVYPENRRMYGASVNLPLGDWAIGSELSYRPREAVALNPAVSGCASQGGNCWVDQKRYQWALTGTLNLQPSGTGREVLQLLGASSGTLLVEAVAIRFPGLKSSYGGDPVAAGGYGWGQLTDPTAAPMAKGSRNSWGYNLDFSWTYDGSLIPGWQVIPEIYYFQAVSGNTPTSAGTFMKGAKSANLTVSFVQNPAKWQFGVNYAKFWGGDSVFQQPYRNRDFVGMYASRNF
ncbi:DUF1302 domain-containing protein [Variovorax sp. E3]|uniref:DUF1302 domain-containing protein n=1 Tax=Variovorax sp. E3 TaxID=1914993 RepID=UPI0018DB089B|nr:DUF1302 domain-containing protein [Variovorax sp. E3]